MDGKHPYASEALKIVSRGAVCSWLSYLNRHGCILSGPGAVDISAALVSS